MSNRPDLDKLKIITCFDDALHYVSRLGFADNGNIAMRQANLCTMADKLLAVSNNATWYHKEFKPFKVRLIRKYVNGNYVPWKSAFLVEDTRWNEFSVHWIDKNATYRYEPKSSRCSGYGSVNDPYHECDRCTQYQDTIAIVQTMDYSIGRNER